MYKVILILIEFFFYYVVDLNGQWIYQQVPTNATNYNTIEFPNSQIGIAGGGFIDQTFHGRGAYTTNAGMNWYISQVPDSLRIMVEIKFVNLTTGYCAGAYNLNSSYCRIELYKYEKRTFQILPGFDKDTSDNYRGLFMKSTNSGQNWFTYGTLPSNV